MLLPHVPARAVLALAVHPPMQGQLNVSGFTSCLARRGGEGPITAPALKEIHRVYRLHNFDGCLEYLAVYATFRIRLLNQSQARAFVRWTEPYHRETAAVAEWLPLKKVDDNFTVPLMTGAMAALLLSVVA